MESFRPYFTKAAILLFAVSIISPMELIADTHNLDDLDSPPSVLLNSSSKKRPLVKYYSGVEDEESAKENPGGDLLRPSLNLKLFHAGWVQEDPAITPDSPGLAGSCVFPIASWLSAGLSGFAAGYTFDENGLFSISGILVLYSGNINRPGFRRNPDGIIWRPTLKVSFGERSFNGGRGLLSEGILEIPMRRDLTLGFAFNACETPISAYRTGFYLRIFSRISGERKRAVTTDNPDGWIGGFALTLKGFLIRDTTFEEALGEGMEMECLFPITRNLTAGAFFTSDSWDFSVLGLELKYYFRRSDEDTEQ